MSWVSQRSRKVAKGAWEARKRYLEGCYSPMLLTKTMNYPLSAEAPRWVAISGFLRGVERGLSIKLSMQGSSDDHSDSSDVQETTRR
jgi:hypothetical protein